MTRQDFRAAVEADDRFAVTWELIPGRGSHEPQQEEVFEDAETAASGDVVDAVSLTDNPGGTPALSADYLGMKLKERGIEPLVHFTTKDKNRNQIEGLLHALEREDIHNILIMSGDHQGPAFEGQAKAVYDLDPVQTLDFVSDLNDGFEFEDNFGRHNELAETDFFPGAVVSPFKRLEAELMPQYWKLEMKVEKGAEFIIPQVGFDARKFHELIKFIDEKDLDVPVIGNLYVLDPGSARAMNENRIPGAIVTDDLREEVEAEQEGEDPHQAMLERAAKMYAFMKGMGFAGVHIGGHAADYDDVEYIVERGEELAPDWEEYVSEFDFPMEDGFYYYERDPETGLNADEHAILPENPSTGLKYKGFKVAHELMFEPDGPLFGPMRWFSKKVDDSALEEPFTTFERVTKTISNDCQECGNCALFDMAYLCPMSQCPKNERNGPCGGSYDGWCEVYPGEQECIYVRAYRKLKADGGLEKAREKLRDTYIPPPDYDLEGTSSWLNYYLGRDYAGKRVGNEVADD
ncbi:methylenetetrahydrofolate reductase C-terminal domain-containing protein [Halodesulfurarchaeum formicicum]|uniref:Methylenetetrahydrofolate reductase (NADPH) n=1 Tax=Halodesulfurarchaeum formicicum TaxID=1873524 RepID=A0A1J1AC64_9EURY|nr:methylenetetrahydrofolate reductase C-terminal domain-containing protein [Halodesulfurarchaeum formicicum]APE95734.1 methylenetetrahydrofolate reductase (NADPH) [Halodesulfurarchaeum formicicum]